MNLKEFTEAIDQRAQQMAKEELQCFVHSIARKVPEKYREEFMGQLADIQMMGGENGLEEEKQIAVRVVDEKEIQKELARIKELFVRIEDGELCINAEGYEDYSEGYWDSEWIWEYEDPDGVSRVFEDACLLIQRCINDEFYTEALEVFELMMESEIQVENDSDEFYMGLEELKEEKLVSIDLNKLALEILYAVYQTTSPKERAAELYSYISISFFRYVRLEHMLSMGRRELKGLPEFWDSWIGLLSQKDGDLEGRLLKEAVLYQKGEEGVLELARISYDKHPSMYLEALQWLQDSHDYARQLETGKEALGKINKAYVLRSEIALSTAEAAIQMQQEEYAEHCWMEAFESATTPVNLLRIMVESNNPRQYQKETRHLILVRKNANVENYAVYEYGNDIKELKRNYISETNASVLRFLSGDFDYVSDLCLQIKRPLGWSGTFVKTGIALFLLLLYQGEKLQQGCLRQADRLSVDMEFDVEQYYKGTKRWMEYGKKSTTVPETNDIFWQCFRRWKACYPLTEEQTKNYLSVMETLVDKRVKAIVSGQHRNHYDSAAALAAALGEVKSSMGTQGAKEELLQYYRDQFPRHSSFHAALRASGMSDKRKK